MDALRRPQVDDISRASHFFGDLDAGFHHGQRGDERDLRALCDPLGLADRNEVIEVFRDQGLAVVEALMLDHEEKVSDGARYAVEASASDAGLEHGGEDRE